MRIHTPRLTLQPHVTANAERINRWRNDPEIAELSSDFYDPETLAQTRARVRGWMEPRDDVIHFAIHLRGSGELIGFLHIALIEPEHRRCAIGVVIGEKQHWGHGYGPEAMRAAVRFCFEELNVNRVAAEAYAINPRSIRMLEKAGFVREGVLRENVRKGDKFVDEYQYSILRREWEAAQRAARRSGKG